ncbi:MAG: hypothetical protein EXS08_03550 [Planctomycetes bacterium]|nr:hypothetical protein [Planctomycetota bacterium]
MPRNARHCPECGRDVSRASAPVEDASAGERRLAARDLRAAQRAVDFVRSVFWMQAAVFGFLTLFLLFALVDPQVPRGRWGSSC